MIFQSDYFKIIIGFLVGAIIGLERQFTREEGLSERRPGIRTFGLISLLGTITAILAIEPGFKEALILGAIFTIILIFMYSVFRFLYYIKDVGITTSVALAISYFLGVLVGFNQITLGITLSIFVTFILAIKESVSEIVRSLEYEEIKSALQIGILALLLLPLIPDIVDPIFGVINVRIFFYFLILVLFLGFLAYMALRKLGPAQGLITFSIIGSVINSEAVTVNLVRLYKENPYGEETGEHKIISSGVLLANTTMIIRTLFLTMILAWGDLFIISRITVALAFPVIVGMFVAYLRFHKKLRRMIHRIELGSPLSYKTATRFALVFTAIVFITVAFEHVIPNLGLYVGSIIGGFVSNAAVVLSIMSLYSAGRINAEMALTAIVLGTIAAVCNKLLYVRAEGGDIRLLVRVIVDILTLLLAIMIGFYFMKISI